MADRHAGVGVESGGRKQRHHRAFGVGGAAPVGGDECVHGLVLAFGQPLIEAFGDADGGVIVADLGLVVPEHRQPAVAAQAVPPGTNNLADAAAGEHGGFPHVAQSAIERVVLGGQTRKIVRVGQRAGDLVGNGRRGVWPVVLPAAGAATTNSRPRPIRSAAPSSDASRSSLRTALNTSERVVVVTMLADPSGRFIASDGRPSRSR